MASFLSLKRFNFLKDYNNTQVLSIHALTVFTIFCFLVDEKSKSKFKLAPLKLLSHFKNPSNSPLQKP
jgi:hypothetical protein